MYENYNSEQVEATGGGLPEGKYLFQVAKEELVEKPDEGKKYILLSLEVAEGDKKGMNQNLVLNLYHKDELTKTIAEETVAKIAAATEKPVNSESPLLGRVFQGYVRPQKKNPDYNEVSAFFSRDGRKVVSRDRKYTLEGESAGAPF